jgi:hypothetical protein
MAENTHADERGNATELKFYVPAGSTSPSIAGRIELILSELFSHGVEPSR